MKTYREALALIDKVVSPLESVERPLRECLGMALAQDVLAPFDLPRFDNSAVDGYAAVASDLSGASRAVPIRLPVAQSVQAGDSGEFQGRSGLAVRIFTGAPMPVGLDSIVMQEDVTSVDGMAEFREPVQIGAHVRRKGEELKAGDTLFSAGTLVSPPVLAALAGVGQECVRVVRKPTVGILTTGNELASPGEPLERGQIYESNSFGIEAALRAMGIESIRIQRAPDDLEATRSAFEGLLRSCDMVISTGGVSVGEFDAVKAALASLNVQEVFWRVAIKPGKPVFFGTCESGGGKPLVFGLPGNPVSALVTFFAFVAPALRALMGLGFAPMPEQAARLEQSLEKPAGRLEFVRCRLDETANGLVAAPIMKRGSHMMGALGLAEGLIHFPLEAERIEAGSFVQVTPLRWAIL